MSIFPLAENKENRETKGKNRVALIEATLESIADIGFARTSVSEIIARANLSRGMIHLHFNGKDNLVVEAAKYASASYYDSLDQLLASAGPSPQERLDAIVRSDLSEEVLNRKSVSIWYAFRGEARERAAIAAYSDTRDARLRDLAYTAFLEMASEVNLPDPEAVARDATHGILAFLEGMWTDYLLHPESFSRKSALRIIFRFLSALFPRYFNLNGSIV